MVCTLYFVLWHTCVCQKQAIRRKMPSFSISAKAYAKIVLHCCKYPQKAVNGVVIGTFSDKDQGSGVQIQDAIPLFHLNLSLAPMLEVALRQVLGGHTDRQLVWLYLDLTRHCTWRVYTRTLNIDTISMHTLMITIDI